MGRLVDEDLTRAGRRLQPRRDVHRVADHGVVHSALRPDVARDHLAGRDADAELQAHALQRRDLEAHDLALHGERGSDGPLGIVGVDHRGTEDRDDAVAEKAGDRALVTLDGISRDGQEPVQQVQDRLRRMLRRERRGAAHVREQRGHLAAIAAQRDGGRITQHLRRDIRADVASQQVGEPILQRLRPKQRAQPRRQLAQFVRLAQEVVGPRLQAAHLVLGTVEGREQQDGEARVLGVATQPLAHLDATGRGHHHVEADEIGLVLGDGTER